MGDCLGDVPREPATDESVDLLSLLGGRHNACANGPDRFVRDDNALSPSAGVPDIRCAQRCMCAPVT